MLWDHLVEELQIKLTVEELSGMDAFDFLLCDDVLKKNGQCTWTPIATSKNMQSPRLSQE